MFKVLAEDVFKATFSEVSKVCVTCTVSDFQVDT